MMPSKGIPRSPAEISVEESELSSHIRHLLFSYVQSHITTPYIQFTEVAVSDLLSGLKPIPVHDPTSLILPTEPLTVYLSTFANSVEPYVEKLQTTNEARLLIKRLLASKPPRVANFADNEDEENHGYHRPSTPPILTRRAVRETPVIGKNREMSKTYAAYIKTALHHSLNPVSVQEISEPQVNLDQILDVKHYIRAEDHAAVRALLKFAAKPPAPAHMHTYLPSSLVENLDASQQLSLPPDSPPFMPIFPRRVPVCPPLRGKRRRDSHGCSAEPTKRHKSRPAPPIIPESMKDMPILVKPAMVNEDSSKADVAVDDLDLSEENMVVVDGWQTFVTSSPSVLSSNSNEEDQLFLPSSPDTDVGAVALVKAVENSKLEDVLIPRSRKVGSNPFDSGEKAKDPEIGRAMSAGFGQFLAPLLQPESAQKGSATISTSRKSSLMRLELEDVGLDSSVLGQASGLSDYDLLTNADEHGDGDAEFHRLYAQMTAAFRTQGLKSTASSHEESKERNKLPVHPYDYIRDEPLFEDGDAGKDGKDRASTSKETKHGKKGGMEALIPVPNLPEPNTYPTTHNRATTLAEYVAPASGSLNNTENRSRGFLKKAKGIAGLRVALSWVPFTLSNSGDPPTHAIVTDVARLFGNTMEETRCDDKPVQDLLRCAAVIEDPAPGGDGERYQGVDERLWSTLGDGDGERSFTGESEGLLRYEIILTREERLEIEMRKGGETRRDRLAQAMLEEERGSEGIDVQSGIDNGHFKRKSVYGIEGLDNDALRYKKHRSLGPDEFNDSGIGMMEHAPDFADITETQREMLDIDTEFEERETQGYTYDVGGEDTFDPGVEGEDAFGIDDEKENRPPLCRLQADYGHISDGGTRGQDGNGWADEGQDAMGYIRWHGDYRHQPPVGDLGDDYSKGFSPHQVCDAPQGAGACPRLNQDSLLGTNGLLDTVFDQSGYIGLNYGHDMDLNEEYDYEMLNDDQDHIGGSFESLPLSFDSQNYQAASARSSQGQAPLGRLLMLGQPYPQARDLCVKDSTNNLTIDGSQDIQASNNLVTESYTKTTDVSAPIVMSTQLKSPQAPGKPDLPSLGPLLDPSFATHALGTAAFARLRGKTLKPSTSTNPTANLDSQEKSSSVAVPQVSRDPPVGLYDRRTLCLPSGPRAPPTTTHKYLASLDLLQKSAVIRALRSPEHCIDLVERVTLDGADLILDVHAALIFVPLLSLPAQTQAEALLARISSLSSKFERLLVVFEAYPASRSVRAARPSSFIAVSSHSVVPPISDTASASPASFVPGHLDVYPPPEPGLYAYTPPVMKAIRKFRRDLDIAEACGTKSAACLVEYAFADSVNEAASFSRMFGDKLEAEGSRECDGSQSTGGQHGVLWGDRAWLDCDPDEDEDGLAVFPGMNRFKAAAVLSQIALGDLLDLDPKERVEFFGGIIGVHSVMAFNGEIERRLGALEG